MTMHGRRFLAPADPVAGRVDGFDWPGIAAALDDVGSAIIDNLLTPDECAAIAGLYAHEDHFRSHVRMARHGFGRGEYRYFKYPLPALVDGLRTALYARLSPIANAWHERLGIDTRYPPHHDAFIARCHAAGQTRPTPLLLQYGPGAEVYTHFTCAIDTENIRIVWKDVRETLYKRLLKGAGGGFLM